MTTVAHITTAEQLLKESSRLGRCELVRGELNTMSPAGFTHGWIILRIAGPLFNYVEKHRLGVITGAETGFTLARNPDTVRAPDVGFVTAERVPTMDSRGFFNGAPDLAVEVLSPDDRAGKVLDKVGDWLEAGCRLVWVVDPKHKTVSVYEGDGRTLVLHESDTVDGGQVVPGFTLPVTSIFTR